MAHFNIYLRIRKNMTKRTKILCQLLIWHKCNRHRTLSLYLMVFCKSKPFLWYTNYHIIIMYSWETVGRTWTGCQIVTLQNWFGDLGEMCGKYSRWLKVPGPLDIGPFLTQFPILFVYIDIYGFWGARYKRGSNFSYLDCYTPKLFWRPRWDMWQVPKMAESTGTSWYLTQFPILFAYIDIYGFWGARYKIGYNFSYLDCYTPKLFWRPRWYMWKVPKMAESTGTSWYWTLFDPVPYSICVYWYIWVLGGPL